MASDDVIINIRSRGGKKAAQDAGLAAKGIRSIGRTASSVEGRVNRMTGSLASGTFRRIGQSAQYAAFGIAAIGVGAVASGLKFNASMEQNEVAFTQFLGSAQAARKELQFLYKTAASTPFETTNITQAARQLLAYGFSAKQANSYIATIGDSIAGSGGGVEQIDSLVRAIGQIRGKGKLAAEELNQIGELGVLDRGKFAKNLGITTAELADAGNQGIKSDKALRALKKTLDESFGGASIKQSKTFNGQVSTLRDNLNMTLGVITKPAFNALKDRVFPQLNAASGDIKNIFGRKGLDMADKITMSRAVLRRRLGPLWDEVKKMIASLHVPEWLGKQFGAAVPRIASAVGKAAPYAAAAFVTSFVHSGIYGQLFVLGALAAKLGVFSTLADLAAARFSTRFAARTAAGTAAAGAGGGLFGKALKFGKGAALGAAGGVAAGVGAFVYGSGLAGGRFGSDAGLTPEQERANLRKYREQAHGSRSRSAVAAPHNRRGGDTVIHNYVVVDGKVVTKSVRRAVRDDRGRR